MCGFIFQKNLSEIIDHNQFNFFLNGMSWRGIDSQNSCLLKNNTVGLGHCRLAILDLSEQANQPMISKDNRYYILLNGEIYNHLEIRKKHDLICDTNSDTETVLAAYIKLGNDVFSILDGMFAIVIYDTLTSRWVAARDAFGIKPLYMHKSANSLIVASEASTISKMINAKPSPTSLAEWEIIRRPIPGYSFFEDIYEVLPGSIIDSDGYVYTHWSWERQQENFEQEVFEQLLIKSISDHELSDVQNVSLLSGGLDSALILACSNIQKCYTVGLVDNNEFEGALDTSNVLNRDLTQVTIDKQTLQETWKFLTRLKGEPLSLPNEALIFKACKAMLPTEKVILTGEGADELLFGYDNIFRWIKGETKIIPEMFLQRYGYSQNCNKSDRLIDFIHDLSSLKKPIDFLEDFFYQVHLPGLLRRMDFASMAASKEARVPFVSKGLISYMYRQPYNIKINKTESKIPIRKLAEKFNLQGALNRKKIGFSAQLNRASSRYSDYQNFRNIILGELLWS